MILNKRISRELRTEWIKYGSLVIMIIVSVALIVSLANKASVVNTKLDDLSITTNLEDGEFILHAPLSQKQLLETKKLGVELQEQFYVDYFYSSTSKLRMYAIRDNINNITLDEGSYPKDDNEMILEQRFAKFYDFHVGDTISIAKSDFTICGIGTTLDYTMLSENVTDVLADEESFSTFFVTNDKFKQMTEESEAIRYEYAYILREDCTDNQLKKHLMNLSLDLSQVKNSFFLQVMQEQVANDISNKQNEMMLAFFLKSGDNQRITSCRDDSLIYQKAALIAGIFVFMILAYMISTFITNRIENESAIIGTLYSLGYTDNEVLRYYLKLPIIITLVASTLGMGCGLLLTPLQVQQTYDYYSIPKCEIVYPIYLFIYGIVIPVVITFFVNYLVLRKKLRNEPLKLLRSERNLKNRFKINISKLNFKAMFVIRQFINSLEENIMLFIGLFLSILILMFGIGIYACIYNYNKEITEDVKYQYQYVLNYPISYENYEQNYSDTEIGYTEVLSTNYYLTNKDMDVYLQGINPDNRYFPFNLDAKPNEVFISDAVAYKFNWKIGDEIDLEDRIIDKNYSLKICGIVKYSSGLYIFMDTNNMRDLFGKKDDYFNTIFSNKKLTIEEGRIGSITTREQLIEAAKQMYDFMEELYIMMIGAAVIIFIIVMYQLLKMIIDKSERAISMLKIFGYKNKEINRIYLEGSFITIIITILVSLKLAGMIVKKVYPYMVSNRAAALPVVYTPYLVLMAILLILVTYTVVMLFLKKHLNQIAFSEILRSKE